MLGVFLLAGACSTHTQQATALPSARNIGVAQIIAPPDAPEPLIEVASAEAGQNSVGQQPAGGQTGQSQPAASSSSAAAGQSQNDSQDGIDSAAAGAAAGVKNGATQGCTGSQGSSQQSCDQKSRAETSQEEVKEEEHQRVAGIVPSFNVTYHADAVSLTPAQKFQLEFRAAIDPYTFSIAMVTAALGEAEDSNTGFGWGPTGFAQRSAAAYADNVIGNTLGNAVLPSILHQDPRYFRLGHGSIGHRIFYSFSTSFICKHDNTGKWEPNYSNVLGNMIAGEISTLYYPNSKSGATQAIETGLTVTFEGAFGAELQEFWPDISRKLFHRDPTHGLDAQARAIDAAQKQKKQQEDNQK